MGGDGGPIWLEIDGSAELDNIRDMVEAGVDTFVWVSAMLSAASAGGLHRGVVGARRRTLERAAARRWAA